ncbi:sce7726 family protein [Caulobacter sp. Root487D2Y]|uniref:sce7726 family protein n=1 Tax=Caulobacter sp. Root487D2Y TaxID=1736547 RepID=UPI000AA62C63|nr:sce7726 family protein [Caulobacter sp. Root487D2Y]
MNAEAEAKVAVLQHFDRRRRDLWTRVISELPLPALGIRADLIVSGRHPTAIEIKTENDNLSRLAKQTTALSHAFPLVYVAASTNHIRKISFELNPDFGLIELKSNGVTKSLRTAKISRAYSPSVSVEVLPNLALANWLGVSRNLSRQRLLAAIRAASKADQARAFRSYLSERASTQAFKNNISEDKSSDRKNTPKRVLAITCHPETYGSNFGKVPAIIKGRFEIF